MKAQCESFPLSLKYSERVWPIPAYKNKCLCCGATTNTNHRLCNVCFGVAKSQERDTY